MRSLSLTTVELKNFKCFRDQRIELGMLTVLSGLNGVGKSSVVHALLLLHQSVSSGHAQRRLRLSGELVDLGTSADVLFDLADEDVLAIVLEFGGIRRSAYVYGYSHKGDRSALEMRGNQNDPSAIEKYKNSIGEWIKLPPRSWKKHRGPHLNDRSFFSGSFQYLSAERYGPRKSLPWSEEQASMKSLGSQGEHVLSFLATYGSNLLRTDDPRIKDQEKTQTVEGQYLLSYPSVGQPVSSIRI